MNSVFDVAPLIGDMGFQRPTSFADAIRNLPRSWSVPKRTRDRAAKADERADETFKAIWGRFEIHLRRHADGTVRTF